MELDTLCSVRVHPDLLSLVCLEFLTNGLFFFFWLLDFEPGKGHTKSSWKYRTLPSVRLYQFIPVPLTSILRIISLGLGSNNQTWALDILRRRPTQLLDELFSRRLSNLIYSHNLRTKQ